MGTERVYSDTELLFHRNLLDVELQQHQGDFPAFLETWKDGSPWKGTA